MRHSTTMLIRISLLVTLGWATTSVAAKPSRGGDRAGGQSDRRLAAATNAFALASAGYATGQATIEVVYSWSRRLLEAEADGPAGKRPALGKHLTRMKRLAKRVRARHAAGAAPALDKAAAEYFVAEASRSLAAKKRGK